MLYKNDKVLLPVHICKILVDKRHVHVIVEFCMHLYILVRKLLHNIELSDDAVESIMLNAQNFLHFKQAKSAVYFSGSLHTEVL